MFYHNWGTTCNPYMTYNCEMSEMNVEIMFVYSINKNYIILLNLMVSDGNTSLKKHIQVLYNIAIL